MNHGIKIGSIEDAECLCPGAFTEMHATLYGLALELHARGKESQILAVESELFLSHWSQKEEIQHNLFVLKSRHYYDYFYLYCTVMDHPKPSFYLN
jgi:hypothetical protein